MKQNKITLQRELKRYMNTINETLDELNISEDKFDFNQLPILVSLILKKIQTQKSKEDWTFCRVCLNKATGGRYVSIPQSVSGIDIDDYVIVKKIKLLDKRDKENVQ